MQQEIQKIGSLSKICTILPRFNNAIFYKKLDQISCAIFKVFLVIICKQIIFNAKSKSLSNS